MIQKAALIFLVSIIMAGCGAFPERGQNKAEDDSMKAYKPDLYFEPAETDSLLTHMATYIGLKPKAAASQTRFDADFRPYYIEYSKQFKLVYFHIDPNGDHFYYLLRPARHLDSNKRGVGGKYRMENDGITKFEEIFNTPVFDEETLKSIGATLFLEMIENGNVDQYFGNRLYIEWPDHRLRYHKGLHEWRYDVEVE